MFLIMIFLSTAAVPIRAQYYSVNYDKETVAAMVENAKKNRRYTGLKLRLQGKTE